ncbi:ribonuclease HII [Actinotalea sp. K2]|uniref:ribonuclease HII n=1 Tax=Actinotalea sp. K2 TaxID=2939438 RepID=UPI0020175FF5|nr:ribonuclease HII [Actinotalea sp. K2]MCL3860239.1 ribonuclease HII [Actinotalea sp. K2]
MRRPDLRHERALLRSGARLVVGMDEVGRGALAGPVSVGAVAVDLRTRACPAGVADSKLLSPSARERLLPALGRWGVARAVGHASPQEIDSIGIIAALRLAGRRALADLAVEVDVVLLDGSHNWLREPVQPTLFDLGAAPPPSPEQERPGAGAPSPTMTRLEPAVRTKVRADQVCASVAAASVLAKCERDALMVALARDHPRYLWDENKGYASPGHIEALRRVGACTEHRRSWRLPGLETGWTAQPEQVALPTEV